MKALNFSILHTYKHSIVILFFSFSLLGFSQVKDKQNASIRIPAAPSKVEKDSIPTKVKVAPKLDLNKAKVAKTEKRFKSKSSERPFSMLETDGLKSPGEIFENRWKKDLAKSGVIRTMSDQYLGEHRVDTKFVNLICRDHEYPDGDRVRIVVNGTTIQPSLLLTGNYRRIDIDLKQGKNIIDIIALNQGESGPNTAEFIVYDDKGNTVSSKEWNLLTGVKARIVFINEKIPITEKPSDDDSGKDEASNN